MGDKTYNWTLTSETDPRWNASGTTTEDPWVYPPEVLAHMRACKEKYGPVEERLELIIKDGNGTWGKYLDSAEADRVEAEIARQKPVPPPEVVALLVSVQELWQVLEDDSYRAGDSYMRASHRLGELAMDLPSMGYFETNDAAEALAWVKPMTEAERVACVRYLKAGGLGIGWKGIASCRVCGETMGTTCNITPDGRWKYPAKWEHYIEAHDVRPPNEEFITSAIGWALQKGIIVQMNTHKYSLRRRENLGVTDLEGKMTGCIYVVAPGETE